MQLHSFSRRCNVTAIPGAVALICLPNSILSRLHVSETKCPDSLARASNDRSNSFPETREYPYLKYFATLFEKKFLNYFFLLYSSKVFKFNFNQQLYIYCKIINILRRLKDYKIPTITLQNLKSTTSTLSITLNEDSENPARKENAEDKKRKAKNPAILLSGK